MDGIYHVCRAFDDPDVTHVEDRVDPVADLDIIHAELRLKDIERLGGERRALAADAEAAASCCRARCAVLLSLSAPGVQRVL